jgi:hypothetical protein
VRLLVRAQLHPAFAYQPNNTTAAQPRQVEDFLTVYVGYEENAKRMAFGNIIFANQLGTTYLQITQSSTGCQHTFKELLALGSSTAHS